MQRSEDAPYGQRLLEVGAGCSMDGADLLAAALQTGGFVTWSLDPETREFTYLACPSEKLCTLPKSLPALLARVHDRDLRAVEHAYMALARDEGPLEVEYRILSSDSNWSWVRDCGQLARATSNAKPALVGTRTNIQGAKLREASERWAQRAGRIGLYEIDMRTGVVKASQSFFRLYGLNTPPEGRWTRQDWISFVYPSDRERVIEHAAASLSARTHGPLIDYRIVRGDGEVRWTRSRTDVDFDSTGAALRAFGVQQDITDLKEAETALARREAELDAVFEHTPVAMLQITRGGILLRANLRAYDMLGAYLQVNKSVEWARHLPPEYLSKVQDHLSSDDPARLQSVEIELRKGDGTKAWVTFRAADVSLVGQDQESKVITLEDVTQSKLDAELRELLRDKLDKSAKLQIAGAMGATLAHELQQPHAALQNYLHAARSALESNDATDRIYTALDKALEQVSRAGSIVRKARSIVSLGKAESEAIDLCCVVSEAVSEARLANIRPRILLRVGLGPIIVQADAIHIHQVISNLVWNAIQASEHTRECVIEITVESGDSDASIQVRDNGPGIPPDLLTRIWEPFVGRRAGGLGLGLQICKALVEAHNGKIEITSEPGSTCVTFKLPKVAFPHESEQASD